MGFKKNVFRNYINSKGIRTPKKLISIQSDDWGSIRIPNKKIFNKLENDLNLNNCSYSKYDSLETANDIHAIVDVLNFIKLKYNKKPIITLNYLSCNPNFERIRKDNFCAYYPEKVQTTYENYDGYENALKYINGDYQTYFDPQFHGREHLNPEMWLELLKHDQRIRLAFDHDIFALGYNNIKDIKYPYLASFMKLNPDDSFEKVIEEGLQLHSKTFKNRAMSFIAPVYVWDVDLENSLKRNGIKTIQGLFKRKISSELKSNPANVYRRKKLNCNNQLQNVRNCFFEPSTKLDYDWVNECLRDIEVAFKWNRPAIICSHRLNFTGRLDIYNRNKNLELFKSLLESISVIWPDVEFVDSETLYDRLI